MDSQTWHDRFLVQAQWTKNLRDYLFQQTSLNSQARVLEVGCGTGAIIADLDERLERSACGIDFHFDHLKTAAKIIPAQCLSCADAYHLPFSEGSFDFVICHYFLLWIKEPLKVLSEIYRVLTHGGTFIAFAEPDHLGRIDAPEEFWQIAAAQTRSLIQQGINPMMGRLLPAFLNQAGFINVQFGVSGFQQQTKLLPAWLESEWNTIKQDLRDHIDPLEFERLRIADLNSRENGSRVMWIPTFYAFGNK